MRVSRILAVVACFCAGAPLAHADAFRIAAADVAADFSSTDNPNRVWRYGWSLTLGSPLILSSSPRTREGLDTWPGDRAADGNPSAYHNGTADAIVLGGTARFEAGQFGLHPGPAGEYAIVRYTAPAAGGISIMSVFRGQDLFGTTSDVHVVFNGVSLLDGFVEGFGSSSAIDFDRTLIVDSGDTIDFAVGFGRNGSFFNDSTALAALIRPASPVPEPATLTLLSVGLACAVTRRGRERRV
jgi:hypothetical protein